MNLKSKKTSLVVLGITSILCSGVMFHSFNDPEGPNLLVIIGGAAIIYFPSLAVYLLKFSSFKKLLLTILIQIIIATGLYLGLS